MATSGGRSTALSGALSVRTAQLAGSTVATFTLSAKFARFEVVSDGAGEVSIRSDATLPTARGNDCVWMPATPGSVELPDRGLGATTVVQCISPGTPVVSVRGLY